MTVSTSITDPLDAQAALTRLSKDRRRIIISSAACDKTGVDTRCTELDKRVDRLHPIFVRIEAADFHERWPSAQRLPHL